jgi:hypothetical protein
MFRAGKFLLLLAPLAACLAIERSAVQLHVPLSVNSSSTVIDGSWQSFSIEYSYMADYFGNLT